MSEWRKCKACHHRFSTDIDECPTCGTRWSEEKEKKEKYPRRPEKGCEICGERQFAALRFGHQLIAYCEQHYMENFQKEKPTPAMSDIAKELREAYARSPHGSNSTHPLIVKHQKGDLA